MQSQKFFVLFSSSSEQKSKIFRATKNPALKSLNAEIANSSEECAPYVLEHRPQISYEETKSFADALKMIKAGISSIHNIGYEDLTEEEKEELRKAEEQIRRLQS